MRQHNNKDKITFKIKEAVRRGRRKHGIVL